MKMQKWLNARSMQLLDELNSIPLADDTEDKRLKLVMSAMREASVEMFHRAAENSRNEIEKINQQAMQESILEVEANLMKEEDEGEVEKQEPKIKLKSSVIRRVDSF